MQTNRRNFLAGGITSLAFASTAQFSQSQESANQTVAQHSCLDYGLSFICNAASFNTVRFWVESKTTFIDEQSGKTTAFYQCGSCKSENTFAESDLFKEDNYDFMPILGDGEWLIYRRTPGVSENYRQVTPTENVWGDPIMKLREGKKVTALETWEQIRDSTAEAVPLVSQTELKNEDLGLRAIIECPIKTMNVSLDDKLYQVDTGPIVYPDLTKRYENPIDSLSLAFVAFNAPNFADFVVEQPTPVMKEEPEACQTYHYSKPFSLPATNRVLAVALPE